MTLSASIRNSYPGGWEKAWQQNAYLAHLYEQAWGDLRQDLWCRASAYLLLPALPPCVRCLLPARRVDGQDGNMHSLHGGAGFCGF